MTIIEEEKKEDYPSSSSSNNNNRGRDHKRIETFENTSSNSNGSSNRMILMSSGEASEEPYQHRTTTRKLLEAGRAKSMSSLRQRRVSKSSPPIISAADDDVEHGSEPLSTSTSTPKSTTSTGEATTTRDPKKDDSSTMNDIKEDGEKEENEDDEDVQEEALPLNIFSLMFVCNINSRAYLYAVAVYCVQAVVVFAALIDSFDLQSSDNPAQIPPGVREAVTVAQAAMIPIAVASQNDFIAAVVRLNDRLYENIVDIDPLHPTTTYCKWLMSSVAQLLVGCGILCVSFLFMMQSDSVFQVLVNIIALFAISNISAAAFNVASRGFLGYRIWKETLKVSDHTVKRKYTDTATDRWFIQMLYLLCLLGFYLGFGYIVNAQKSGHFLCPSVFMQFDDEFVTNLPYRSGVYRITDRKIASRFVYVDDVTGTRFILGYCAEKNAWGLATASSQDPCADSILSQPSFSFDVMTTGQVPWRVRTQRDNSLVETRSFLMQCVKCDLSSCPAERGTCVNNECICFEGRYGINCQFQHPCEELVLNSNRGTFPPVLSLVNEDYVVLPEKYHLLKEENGTIATSYHRPVYYSEGYDFVLMFSGRRWVIVSPTLWAESGAAPESMSRATLMTDDVERQESFSEDVWRSRLLALFATEHLYDYLTDPFLQQFFTSEQVEARSALDQGSPVGLRWLAVRAVRTANRPVLLLDNYDTFDVSFICTFCEDDVNDCQNLARCNNVTKKCECRNSTLGFPLHSGALCERGLTCDDVRQDYGDLLPTGCVGDFVCQADGFCDCTKIYPQAGTFCQFLPCNDPTMQEIHPPNGCKNEGICSNVTGSCICDNDLFEGKYCQNAVAGCNEATAQRLYSPTGCDNNGVCNNITGFCECESEEFTGRFCQRSQPRCDSRFMQEVHPPSGCASNGVCNVDTGVCDCPFEGVFKGRYCEITELHCDDLTVVAAFPGGCANNGICNTTSGECLCDDLGDETTIYSGKYCQNITFNATDAIAETSKASGLRNSVVFP